MGVMACHHGEHNDKFATYSKNSLYALATIRLKSTVFTLQEKDVTAKKAGGNMTTHAQHRII